MKILLVEDNINEVNIVKALLSQSQIENFEIETAQTLKESIDKKFKNHYDIVLLKLNLPDSRGIETAVNFHKFCPDTPIIAVSDIDDEVFTVTAIQAGIQDCIVTGTYNKNMLIRTICFAIERQQALMIKDDITRRREDHFLTHDQLTGLPNKRFLIDYLNRSLVNDIERKKRYALFNIELQGLQQVNYSLGLSYGDVLLKNLGNRLNELHNDDDAIVARSESFQFSSLLPKDMDEKQVSHFAEELLLQLRKPIMIQDEKISITTSIGISRYPCDTHDPEDLIEKAYIATRIAKEEGWHKYCLYSNKVSTQFDQYTAIFHDLKTAQMNGELFLLIQPKVDLKTRATVRGEALIRWQHPKLGLVSPGQFIKIAEETNMIVSIGEWVIRNCLQLIRGFKKNHPDIDILPIDINISPVQVSQLDFIESLERIFSEYSEELPYLGAEITESAIMSNQRDGFEVLRYLKSKNTHISIDDFGTGYSSLSYLRLLPADTVKIDRSFIKDVHKVPHNAEIVKSTIDMVHALGMMVVAEGVEDAEEVKFLTEHGCDQAQGFYFSKPMLPEVFISSLKKNQL